MCSLTTDANGNTTSNGIVNYTWNDENRLVSEEPVTPAVNDKKLEYVYDGLGRRRVKKVYSWDGANWQSEYELRFAYDGFKPIAELDNSDTLLRSYLLRGDELLSLTNSGGTYFYVLDGNKNVMALTDASGNIANEYFYSPFGDLVKCLETIENPFKFSSEYFDPETEKIYFIYRYYIPRLARWPSKDPINEAGFKAIHPELANSSEEANLYKFINNNAVNDWDILGLYTIIYQGKWKSSELYRFERNMNKIKSKLLQARKMLKSLKQQYLSKRRQLKLQKKSCECLETIERIIKEISKTEIIFAGMTAEIRGEQILRVRKEDLGSSRVAGAEFEGFSNYPSYSIVLNVGEHKNYFERGDAASTLFHELSHYSGSLDPEEKESTVGTNAYNLESFMLQGIDYKGQIKQMGNKFKREIQNDCKE